MLEKLILLSETEDQILQKISDNLGISEENLIRQVLTDFLARQADDLEFEEFMNDTIELSKKHQFTEDYHFNRQELYEENNEG
jgi:ribosomal protein S3AE